MVSNKWLPNINIKKPLSYKFFILSRAHTSSSKPFISKAETKIQKPIED